MQTRVRYASVHKAVARPPEPRIQECWEGKSHTRGVCARPYWSTSQVAGPAYSAHAPQRRENKPPEARRSIPRIQYSMAEKLRGPPTAQSSKGIKSSGQRPREPGYSPRFTSSLQRPPQTITSGLHFVPHTGKKFLQQGKKGVPKGSSCPPIICLPARPRNPGARGQNQQRPRKIVFEDELPIRRPEVTLRLDPQPGSPQPQLVPDYILRYPAIYSEAERRRYKAVFQDQHSEYQELRQNVATAMAKFQELEALLATLPQPVPKQEEARLAWVQRELERKKQDPVFLEQQTRCDYLKRKLRHLKAQIQKYDEKNSQDGSVYF